MGRRRQGLRKHVFDALNNSLYLPKILFRCQFSQFVIKCHISHISIGTLQASLCMRLTAKGICTVSSFDPLSISIS